MRQMFNKQMLVLHSQKKKKIPTKTPQIDQIFPPYVYCTGGKNAQFLLHLKRNPYL